MLKLLSLNVLIFNQQDLNIFSDFLVGVSCAKPSERDWETKVIQFFSDE